MRRVLGGSVVLGLTLVANLVQAAGHNEADVLHVQLPPLPSQPIPADPAQPAPRLPQPGLRPWTLPFRAAPASCVKYTMKIVPANPGIDPKFILPAPDAGVNHSMRKVTPPPGCQPATPVPPTTPATPVVPRTP